MELYSVRHVCRRYGVNGHAVPALSDVSLEIGDGEFVALAGPSGSGKTTLLNILGLLDEPDQGTVSFAGEDVSGLGERERTRLRRERIAFVFQALNLIPVLTARENVEYPLLKRGESGEAARQRADQALDAVGLDRQSGQRANTLSGGERQRVAVARALARGVGVVLADEPTAALDQATGHEVVSLMQRLNREQGITFIFSSHDPSVLAAAGRVISLADGRIK